MPKFCITPEGKIYTLNPDGSTTELGTITPDGRYSWPDGTPALRKEELKAKLSKFILDKAHQHIKDAVNEFLSMPTSAIQDLLRPAPNTENSHECVDLGLPSGLKWATCNIGASKPEEYGDYFAWGETVTKEVYYCASYKLGKWEDDYWMNAFTGSKYVTRSAYGIVDNKSTLDPEDDAATANWGGKWRMPTDEEFDELIENCEWEWTEQSGVEGYLVKSKTNSASLFLPAAGYRYGSDLNNAGSYGYYWSASLYSGRPYYARGLDFGSGYQYTDYGYRFYGHTVRPVCP